MSNSSNHSLTERFHSVQSVLPSNQKIAEISPDASVADALDLLTQTPYSQLVVKEGPEVFGLFSYRSFATAVQKAGRLKRKLDQLPVEDFMQRVVFASSLKSWESFMEDVARDDAVLVGSENNLEGILTAMDFVSFLKRIAEPFVLIAEIEQALRDAMRAVATPDELKVMATRALNQIYSNPDKIPSDPDRMTFSEYVNIIGNRNNWPQFAPLFGSFGQHRYQTDEKLGEVDKLRNIVFHFRRPLEEEDIQTLQRHRNWLRRRLRVFSGAKSSAQKPSLTHVEETTADLQDVVRTDNLASLNDNDHQVKTPPIKQETPKAETADRQPTEHMATPTSGKHWTEERLFAVLAEKTSSAEVAAAREIYEWGLKNMPSFYWGKGKRWGSVTVGLSYNNIWHQLFAIVSTGYIEVQLQYMQKKPPFDNVDLRRKLAKHLNQIDDVAISDEQLGSRPSIQLHQLVDTTQRVRFLEAADWFVEQIKASPSSAKPTRYTLRRRFWTQLLDKARNVTPLHANIKASRDSWIQTTAGMRGLTYVYVIRMRDARIELYIDQGNSAANNIILHQLKKNQTEIEATFGDNLIWLPYEDKRASKIEYPILDGGLQDQEAWPQIQAQMIDAMVRFEKALKPFIQTLI